MEDDEHAISYQALPRGLPVHASGGEAIGTVHRVLDNAREHIFDGIVISTEAAFASSTRPRSSASPTAACC